MLVIKNNCLHKSWKFNLTKYIYASFILAHHIIQAYLFLSPYIFKCTKNTFVQRAANLPVSSFLEADHLYIICNFTDGTTNTCTWNITEWGTSTIPFSRSYQIKNKRLLNCIVKYVQ